MAAASATARKEAMVDMEAEWRLGSVKPDVHLSSALYKKVCTFLQHRAVGDGSVKGIGLEFVRRVPVEGYDFSLLFSSSLLRRHGLSPSHAACIVTDVIACVHESVGFMHLVTQQRGHKVACNFLDAF